VLTLKNGFILALLTLLPLGALGFDVTYYLFLAVFWHGSSICSGCAQRI